MSVSLVQYFKQNPTLNTDIGAFEYVSSLGQGGNAYVLSFKRQGQEFAIKFIPHNEEGKLRRFRDEFFGAAQIPTHVNVVDSYHFDTTDINGTKYSLIVMKAYSSTLSKLGSIANKTDSNLDKQAWELFVDLCKGLHHLHSNHIIHRDIKPQNIFYDEETNAFVIGDLGIAHFKAEVFAKEAHTQPSDRLANYLFSAPEQADSKNKITEAADIYSLGQVMQWYLTGATVRGQGRTSFATKSLQDKLSILDRFISKAIRDKPAERFQSIEEIYKFVKSAESPSAPDPWVKIEAFDETIRRSFPQIRKTLVVTDHEAIDGFLTSFQHKCSPNDFWYVMADGGDGNFRSLKRLTNKISLQNRIKELRDLLRNGRDAKFDGIKRLGENSWLLNGQSEMTVSKLLVHRDNNFPYKNFFILIFGPDKRFIYSKSSGKRIMRKPSMEWSQDYATLVDDSYYIDPNDVSNGYYRMGNITLQVSRKQFKDRERYLIPYGVMVIPTETASASMLDREPTSNMIHAAIRDQDLKEEELQNYLNATRAHHSAEITKWN